MRPLFLHLLAGAMFAASASASMTLVNLHTPVGDMTFQLYDEAKPVTVANFLNYVTSGRYEDTFAHRLIPSFILQGGFAGADGDGGLFAVGSLGPIMNEAGPFPEYSNVLGTLSMAKVPAFDENGDPIPGGGPDSATSQWFINLGNNSANLDAQNGGFTVFGAIVSGMDVLQQFNTFTNYVGVPASDVIVNASGVNSNFSTLPVTHMDGSSTIYLADLVYTTWSVVTPVPEPADFAVAIPSGLGLLVLIRSFRPSRARARGGPVCR